MINKILIANRGEIAVRVIQACREMGITSVAVYSDADKNSLHVRLADQAHYIGKSPSSESYLNIPKIIETAKEVTADAIHPGYGFLSENSEFIKAVREAGIIFIGPSEEAVKLMGNKSAARQLMQKHHIPIVPGNTEPIDSLGKALTRASEIGFPVMLKASAGGGGKGMRLVHTENELEESLARAKNEAKKAFNNDDIYIEKYIENPKHIEVQILGDTYGNYIHLFERDCSVQRRHQKVLEESPSLAVNNSIRQGLTEAAIKAAKACGYYNAGTVEFLLDKSGNFYFMEMNTRLQVEHPVTEMITGIDLVKEQIKIASGEKLSIKQEDVKINGHAIECRIYAEDIDNNFAPSGGKILHHKLPSGTGIRVDRGIDVLTEVPLYYDPILAKVISHGRTRQEAIERMKRALGEYKIVGVTTNIGGFRWVFNQEEFLSGNYSTGLIPEKFIPLMPGKWKQEVKQEYLEVIYLLTAHLKNEENRLKPIEQTNSEKNGWYSLNHD